MSVTILTIKDSSWLSHFFGFQHRHTNSFLGINNSSNVDYNYCLDEKVGLNEKISLDSENSKYRAALDASLYADLRKLMEEEKIYRDPNLSRDKVVARLGTSKKVFLEVLQRNINMNFIDYINTYRLTDAVNLLQKSEYTNETIASEVGFGSVNTFYRQFRLKYGFSPTGYRKSILLKSMNDEIPDIEMI